MREITKQVKKYERPTLERCQSWELTTGNSLPSGGKVEYKLPNP